MYVLLYEGLQVLHAIHNYGLISVELELKYEIGNDGIELAYC